MTRLTEKILNGENYSYFPKNDKVGSICNKLGQLEDIEDRIKFPLEKAFECLEKGAYRLDWGKRIEHCDIRGIEINGLSAISKLCSYAECDELLKYEEYGKTWALTKEELQQ